jgi:hypothetical protein
MTEFNPFDDVGYFSVPINIHGYEGKIIWKFNPDDDESTDREALPWQWTASWKVAVKDKTYGSWIKVVAPDCVTAKQREDAEALLIEHANESISLVLKQ